MKNHDLFSGSCAVALVEDEPADDLAQSDEGTFFVEDDAFFAPAPSDLLDTLLGQYDHARAGVGSLAAYMREHLAGGNSVLDYFLEGNRSDERGRCSLSNSAAQLFDEAGAVASLNAAYWSKALQLTDVLDMMPQKRRTEWHQSISNPQGVRSRGSRTEWETEPIPNFEAETVRRTIMDLLNMRGQFLAERVDGIFRNLSGEHVTNAPEAFNKRMIIARVLSEYQTTDYQRIGLINDLRCVIAKFMGRDEPHYSASDRLVSGLKKRWGEWVSVDGGALRIRLYRKGTAHLEVHPDISWRLNMVLASLYPLAIPAQFRQRPKKRPKSIERIQRPLPFAVLMVLGRMCATTKSVPEAERGFNRPTFVTVPMTLQFHHDDHDKRLNAEVSSILESLGGVRQESHGRGWFAFDYDPSDVISIVLVGGCIPDQKSHQFYPTPESLAAQAVALAEIDETHSIMEPSAGTGGIADQLPKSQTVCFEVSALHSKVLAAKGYTAHNADFLSIKVGEFEVDRVLMNPPFERGQWLDHVEHAGAMVRPGGRLVAILPSGAQSRNVLPGRVKKWHGPFANEFAGASVSVVILVADF